MQFQQIAPNLYISDSPEFGDYNHQVVHELLRSIDINFSTALGTDPFSSRICKIAYYDATPMCTKEQEEHYIYLSIRGSYWGQWVYQFAHEYCHHLIDGEMTGEICGLKWFEESVCELSSLYHLTILCSHYHVHQKQLLGLVAQDHQDDQVGYAQTYGQYDSIFSILRGYLDNLQRDTQLYETSRCPGWLQKWDSVLTQPEYHRDYYHAIALKMLPLFVDNQSLWKVIFHIGDSRKWNSLRDLFDHLIDHADQDYISSLRNLERIMFA